MGNGEMALEENSNVSMGVIEDGMVIEIVGHAMNTAMK